MRVLTGPRTRRRLDLFADGVGYLIAVLVIGGAAIYPLVLAVQSGVWWMAVGAVLVVGVGLAALVYNVLD